MKIAIILSPLLLLIACSGEPSKQTSPPVSQRDTIVVHDTVYISEHNGRDWQAGFHLTHDPEKDSIAGRPVSFYIEDEDCAGLAFDFYYGYFRPSDNRATQDLLALAVTDNNRLRPFYRWCLDKTIEVSDGALGELVGVPARRYAEKFPKEFIEFIDAKGMQTSRDKWVEAITYSGDYVTEDWRQPDRIRAAMLKSMKEHCGACNAEIMKRIERFAGACFVER